MPSVPDSFSCPTRFGEATKTPFAIACARCAVRHASTCASPNRVGHEEESGTDGIEFFGHSFIADPFGRILAEAGTTPAVLVVECDRKLIEETRRNWPFLRDRRIDAYAPILSRYIG